MCGCGQSLLCTGCGHAVNRRGFLQGAGAAAMAVLGGASVRGAESAGPPIRVALVFLSNSEGREIWPYPGYDCEARHAEVLGALRTGCPGIEFTPIVVRKADETSKALAVKDSVDGYLVYTVTLQWELTNSVVQIGTLGKPLLIVDEYLGGSGVFLVGSSQLCRQGGHAALVSTTKLDDLVVAASQFGCLKEPGMTPGLFAERCSSAYRRTFRPPSQFGTTEDRLSLAGISECVRRLGESRFVVVGAGPPGETREYLGAKSINVGFEELRELYDKVDPDEAAECGKKWRERADRVIDATPDWINKAGAVYLATTKLMKKHGAETVTMNCLGGFATGQLPAYPCLGFMQILDDGQQGVCEAMPDDSVSMIITRLLTGRPGYVSDPALDTSKNQIVYAHCMAMTKVFGPRGEASPFRIRTLHNLDPRGCCAQSFLPGGFMTTSFRTNVAQKAMVIHQAKAAGNLDSDRGCRTQLLGEVHGDIGKLFYQWDRFGWHRVTVYGDVKEPLTELANALGLEVVLEA